MKKRPVAFSRRQKGSGRSLAAGAGDADTKRPQNTPRLSKHRSPKRRQLSHARAEQARQHQEPRRHPTPAFDDVPPLPNRQPSPTALARGSCPEQLAQPPQQQQQQQQSEPARSLTLFLSSIAQIAWVGQSLPPLAPLHARAQERERRSSRRALRQRETERGGGGGRTRREEGSRQKEPGARRTARQKDTWRAPSRGRR